MYRACNPGRRVRRESQAAEQLDGVLVAERKVKVRVGETAETALEAIEGQGGAMVTIHNHPLAVAPGQTLVVARSTSLKHNAYGLNLELSGRTAYYSPFAHAGP